MKRALIAALIALAGLLPACRETSKTSKHAPRSPESPDTIELLVPRRTMEAGEKIEVSDLKVVVLETHFKDGLGSNFIFGVKPEDLKDDSLRQRVPRGRFLCWSDILGYGTPSISVLLDEDTELFQVAIEPGQSLGQVLWPRDRIVIMGSLALPGKSIRTYRIIEGAKVVSVDGVAVSPGGSNGNAGETPDYRTIGIQVTRETAMNLHNVLTHLVGHLRVNVLSHRDKPTYVEKKILVAEELRNLPPAVPDDSGS